MGLSQPARAQQIVPGDDPECTITAGEAVCEGDLGRGIVATPGTPGFSSLVVRNAAGPIAPPGYAGIVVVKDNGDVTVKVADDVVIQTYDDPGIAGSAQGLVVQNTNGFGITIDSGAAITTDGNGQAAAALEAAILAGGGAIDITNRGDLSLSTTAQFANALLARQFAGNGDILIDNSGDITTVSGSSGERDQPATGILAYSYEGGGLIDVFNSGAISITTDPGNFDSDFNGIAGGIVTNAIGSPSVTRIANNAAIVASGPQTHGIVGFASSPDTATGVSVSIANGGAISTDGVGAYGLLAQAAGGRANLAINNSASGTITLANADGATGIFALSRAVSGSLTVINSAAISGTGFDAASRAIGLSTSGAPANGNYTFNVTNDGALTLETVLAYGITVTATADDKATAEVTNTGDITLANTTYAASAGILVDLEGAGEGTALGKGIVHIDNSGAIALGSGNAVRAVGNNVQLRNYGSLSTTGDATDTVYLKATVDDPTDIDNGAQVITVGDIAASGAGSSAIYIDSEHTAGVTVGADATVSALHGTAIRIEAPSTTTVNVSGSILAASADDVAVSLPASSPNVYLYLYRGYNIVGKVMAPGTNDWISVNSTTLDLNNPYAWDLNLIGTQFQGFEHLNISVGGTTHGYAVRLTGSANMDEIRFNRKYPDTSYVILDGASLTSGVAMVMPRVYGNGSLSAASMDFVSPGLDGAPFGTITTGDLTLKQYALDVGASGETDLIVVVGTVTLDNAGLTISENGTFGGNDPFHYLILDNDGIDAINGTFTSIDNTFAFLTPTVSYTAGDGNDIAVTLTPNGTQPASGDRFWDGANTSANGTVDGGTGDWNGSSTNWTNAAGSANAAWNDQDAIFGGAAGTVSVLGSRDFTGMTFLTDGYIVADGDLSARLNAAAAGATIDVASGVGAYVGTTFTGGAITKTGAGTLTVGGRIVDDLGAVATWTVDAGGLRIDGGLKAGSWSDDKALVLKNGAALTVTKFGGIDRASDGGSFQAVEIDGQGDVTIDDGGYVGGTISGTADSSTVRVAGTASTDLEFSRLIVLQGSGNLVDVSDTGLVSTTGRRATAIRLRGDDNRIVMDGTVHTAGGGAGGIEAVEGDRNHIAVGGDITIEGGFDANYTAGIYLAGNDGVVDLSGTVTTTHAEAPGILTVGDDNSVTVSGAISTSGEATTTGRPQASAVRMEGAGNQLDISGTVQSGGAGVTTVELLGGSDLALSGTVTAASAADTAILFGNGGATLPENNLELRPGYAITGLVLGDPTAFANNLYFGGDGGSATFDVSKIGAAAQFRNFGRAQDGLYKSGTSTWTLTGTNDSIGSFFRLQGGTLLVNGSMAGTGFSNLSNVATLGGSGTVGYVELHNGGTLAPGNSIGTLTINGDLTLGAGSVFQVEVDDAGNSDKVIVNGGVTLGGGTLNVTEIGSFTGSDPFNYLIVDNDGSDAINGTFGTVENDYAFLTSTVSYTGGDGNDITLTLTPNNVTPTNGCSPDPAPSGASVTCTGTESDGFTDGGTNLSVTVVHGAVVTNTAAEPTATAAFVLKSDSALVNHGRIIMDYPVQEQIEAIHFGARGRLTNASDGVIEVNAADLSHVVLMGDGGVITNQGIIRGTLSGNDFTGDDKGLYLYNGTSLTNEQGGLIDLKLLPTPGAAGPRLTGIYSVVFDGRTTGNTITNAGTIRLTGPDDEGALIGIEATDEPAGDTILNTETGLLDLTGTYLTGVTVRGATNLRNDGTIALHMTYPAGTLADPVRALLGQAIEADWLETTDPVKTIVNTGTITVDGAAATGALLGHRILLQNSGTIHTDGGGYVETQSLKYPNFQLYGSPGVFITGAGSTVDNSGTIEAIGEGSSAVQIGNPLREDARGDPIEPNPTTVINTGLIRGAGNGILAYGETDDSVFTIVNQQGATIEGTGATGTGISSHAGIVDLDNAGTITGAGGAAIALGDFADTVHLRATSVVDGDVLLGGGADQLQADEGTTLNGTVYLGEGDDAIDLATLAYDIAVDGGAGTDTARYLGDGATTSATLDLNSFDFTSVEVFQQGPTSAGEVPAITVNADGSVFSRYDILSGSLAMNGANAGLAVTIGAAGMLKGTGTVGAVASNGGTLAPGNSIGTLTVNGDLTLDAASVFQVEVDDAGNSDRVVVNGGVSLGGSTLDVVESGTFAGSDPFNYLIVDNDGNDAIDGTFGTVQNDYAFLEAMVSYTAGDGNDIGLTLTPTGSTPPPPPPPPSPPPPPTSGTGLFPTVANTYNRTSSAIRLDNLDRSNADADAVYMAVLFTTTPQALAAFDTASGEIYATQLADQAEAGLARNRRLLARAGQQVGEGWGLWGGVKGRTGSIDGDGNAAGADRGDYGAELGIDYRGSGNAWAIGAGVGWITGGELDVDGRASRASYDGWEAGAYLRYGTGRTGPTISAAAAYGAVQSDVTRSIAVNTLSRTAKGSADYRTVSLAGEARYGFGTEDDGWAYGPLASIHFASTEMGSVAETGAAALNLSGSGADSRLTRYGGGLFAGWQGAHGALDVSAQYVTGSSAFGEVALALDGAPGISRPVRSPVTGASGALAVASGRIDLGGDWTLSAETSALIGSGNTDVAASVSVGWSF